MDNRSKEERSKNMARIKSEGTKPEETIRKYLFSQGFRYRKNVKKLPGHPDLVLRKYKTIIFVNGCYWHGHEGCKYFILPKSNVDFWVNKIEYNRKRDKMNCIKLTQFGWNIITVWECELRHGDKDIVLQNLAQSIKSNISDENNK